MFKSKKQESSPNNSTQSLTSNNSIVAGTKVEGNVAAGSDIRIDGELQGNLDCSGRVIVGPEGFIKGTVNCANGVIEGRITGKLICADQLNIRETATIEGEITTGKLNVQTGAVINGDISMGKMNVQKSSGSEKVA